MADVSISYKGDTIAELSDTGNKALLTEGKYCEDDITIEYVKSGGGDLEEKDVTVSQNGTSQITPSAGKDGMSKVNLTVNVPSDAKPEQTKTTSITANGTTHVTPDTGKVLTDVEINVNVPNPSTGTINITENGTYDVTDKANAVVNVQGGGTPTINGHAFKCGKFTLASDATSTYSINHSLGVIPEAVFVWYPNAPISDGENLRYQFFKGRMHSDAVSKSIVGSVANGGVTGSAATAHRFDLAWTDTTIQLSCDATYPLRAGLEYQWIAIAPLPEDNT